MMDRNVHSLSELFAQLGLSSQKTDIESFIRKHPLAPEIPLYDAPFWNEAQAAFLREALMCDSDWAIQADMLGAQLSRNTY